MLTWMHPLSEIGPEGVHGDREANTAERAGAAAALNLPDIGRLAARYAILPLSSGRYRLTGDVLAEVTQVCVVTLEPIPATVEERFEAEFWPPDALPEPEGGEFDALAATDIEPIAGAGIDVGRVVFETLAAGLDPYPRAPGAVFEADEQNAAKDPASGPFAALGKLRQRRRSD